MTPEPKQVYIVRTDDGYLGRYTLDEPLRTDMPRPLAYCWTTEGEAIAMAATYHGDWETY